MCGETKLANPLGFWSSYQGGIFTGDVKEMLASQFSLCLLFIQDVKERFSAALGSLSTGRILITALSTTNLKLALSIAIRFSAARCQFGPTDDEEIPVLEYQTQVNTLEFTSTDFCVMKRRFRATTDQNSNTEVREIKVVYVIWSVILVQVGGFIPTQDLLLAWSGFWHNFLE